MRELHWSLREMASKPVSQWRDRGARYFLSSGRTVGVINAIELRYSKIVVGVRF